MTLLQNLVARESEQRNTLAKAHGHVCMRLYGKYMTVNIVYIITFNLDAQLKISIKFAINSLYVLFYLFLYFPTGAEKLKHVQLPE